MTSWRARLVIHPVTVLSVAVLVLNDHVLKQHHAGLLTGKVSDVAGVWMVASLLIAATGRRNIGVAITAIAFAAVKLSPTVAGWAAPALGGTTLSDATDLIAIAVLPGPWFLARGLANDSLRDRVHGFAHLGLLLVVGSSVVATTATSCDTKAEVDELRSDGTRVFAHLLRGDYGWYEVTLDGSTNVDESEVLTAPTATDSACSGTQCFRVEPRVGVFEGDQEVFALGTADLQRYRKASKCAQTALFESLVIRSTADGPEVWLLAGMSGLVVRSPDGQFHQVTVGDLKVVHLDGLATPRAAVTRETGGASVRIAGSWLVIAVALVLALIIGLADHRKRLPPRS